MSDFIKREDAIMALRLEYPMMPFFKENRKEWAIKTEGYRKAEEVIMRLPSVRPKEGKWIIRSPKPFFLCKCSECGESEEYETDFCPNCGARMKGADDE